MPAEIHKFDGQIWQAITEIQYTDSTLTDRAITEVHYNDGGTWRQVFGGVVTPQVPAWGPSTPTGSYESIIDVGGLNSSVTFFANVSGNFQFGFEELESGTSTGAPTFGTYKPIVEVDAQNYEISISFVGGNPTAFGSGTVINGTFQDLDTTRGIKISQAGIFTNSTSVTVEIRDKATPANTTGPATFVIKAIAK